MGRRFAFDLFYPVGQVRAGLAALEPYLPTVQRRRTGFAVRREVFAPDSGLAALTPNTPLFTSLSLLFPADEHVRGFRTDWEDTHSEWDDTGIESLPVGAIDLKIRVGVSYVVFSYAACTSRMSDLFESSSAVWERFDHILRSSGGLAGLFSGAVSRGSHRYPLLPTGESWVELDYFDFVLEERDTYWHLDVDRYAEAVLCGIT